MNVLIIEDEKSAALRLVKQINELRPDYKITASLDSIESAVEWLSQNSHPDLIFLDIQLSDGLSFAIFEKVKIKVPVIFTTAFDAYAIKAFELNSIDYLLKPVSSEQLSRALDKFESIKEIYQTNTLEDKLVSMLQVVQNKQREPYRERLLIPQHDGYIQVLTEDVAYFYVENNCVYIVTRSNETHTLHYSLDKLEEELDPAVFYRANRSFIVSAGCVKKAHNYFNYKMKLEVIPKTTKEIIISRQKVSDFKKWFNS